MANQLMSTQFRRITKSRAHEGQAMCARMIISFLFCALISQTGCVFLPIPTQERKVLAGNPVTEDQLIFLAPNVTTKSEVMVRLGSPDVIWEEAHLFAYNWEMRQGILL